MKDVTGLLQRCREFNQKHVTSHSLISKNPTKRVVCVKILGQDQFFLSLKIVVELQVLLFRPVGGKIQPAAPLSVAAPLCLSPVLQPPAAWSVF